MVRGPPAGDASYASFAAVADPRADHDRHHLGRRLHRPLAEDRHRDRCALDLGA